MADDLTDRLAVIKTHADIDSPRFNPGFTCDVHVPRLLAAVEEALTAGGRVEADPVRRARFG